jgi:hypothetical protein
MCGCFWFIIQLQGMFLVIDEKKRLCAREAHAASGVEVDEDPCQMNTVGCR